MNPKEELMLFYLKHIKDSLVPKEQVDKFYELLNERKQRLVEMTKDDIYLSPTELARFHQVSLEEIKSGILPSFSDSSVEGHSQVQPLSESTPAESQEGFVLVSHQSQQPCSETSQVNTLEQLVL